MVIRVEPNSKQAYNLLHKGILSLARAERQGICIDMKYCERQQKTLSRKIAWAEDQFRKTSFYKDWKTSIRHEPNIYSPQQLGKFLYEVKHIRQTRQTKSGAGVVDEEALESLDIPELQILLSAKKLKKIRDNYLAGFMREAVNGVIHPSFNLHLVKTFRGSANNPNFQNIPKRDKQAKLITRKALIPREGHQLMEADFGSLEVRIAACYHHDPTMIRYIKDESTDMHRDMAQQIFKLSNFDKHNGAHGILRTAAKNGFVFPQFYGDYYLPCAKSLAKWGQLPEGRWNKHDGIDIGGIKLSDHLINQGIKSFNGFVNHVQDIEADFWENRFPVYARWKERWWNAYQRIGQFSMLTGFTCIGEMGKNNAINYPVQGAAFHCLLWSLITLDKFIIDNELRTRIIGQIHDSIVLDIYPPERQIIIDAITDITTRQLLNEFKWIIVPLKIDFEIGEIDGSWADMKEYERN